MNPPTPDLPAPPRAVEAAPRRPLRGCAVAAGLALTLGAGGSLTAQQDPANPLPPRQNQEPGEDQPDGTLILRPPSLDDLPGQDPLDPDRLSPTWMRPESFQGFPTFPPNLRGYGQYPPPPGFNQRPEPAAGLPPMLAPDAPDWPSWIKSKRPGDLPYDVGTALLVRQADRVWYRPAGDDAFVPLYHFDFARGLGAGTDVRVPWTGDFLLLFFGGARLVSTGCAELRILALDEAGARVAVESFTRFELQTYERAFAMQLPDGSELVCDPAPPPPPDEAEPRPKGAMRLLIDRVIEPGRYSGRATVFNAGDRPARWRTPFGERQIEPGYRVTLFLAPPRTAFAGELVEDGVAANAEGSRRRWAADGAGAVTWSGARFALGAGDTLAIDPMLGDPFAARPQEPRAAIQKDQ